jgi:hypothetical protein
MKWGKGSTPPLAVGARANGADDEADNPYAGMFDASGPRGAKERELMRKAATEESLSPQEEALLEKVQIRPSGATGPAKWVGQAVVLFWVSLVPYVMIMHPPAATPGA